MIKRSKRTLTLSSHTIRPLDAGAEVRGGYVLSATSCARYCVCGPTAVTCQACVSVYPCTPLSTLCVSG